MMTQQGRVVALDADVIWVESIRSTACGGCEAKKGCGTGLIEQWFSRPMIIPIARKNTFDNTPDSAQEGARTLRIGDRIEFALPESAILRGALLTYLIPTLLLVFGGVLGGYFASLAEANADLWSGVGAASGLILFIAGNLAYRRCLPKRYQIKGNLYQPTIVKYFGRIL